VASVTKQDAIGGKTIQPLPGQHAAFAFVPTLINDVKKLACLIFTALLIPNINSYRNEMALESSNNIWMENKDARPSTPLFQVHPKG
jgi:hypothetical protein